MRLPKKSSAVCAIKCAAAATFNQVHEASGGKAGSNLAGGREKKERWKEREREILQREKFFLFSFSCKKGTSRRKREQLFRKIRDCNQIQYRKSLNLRKVRHGVGSIIVNHHVGVSNGISWILL